MARRLGEAYVALEADASLFRASALAGIKKAMVGVDAKVNVTAATARATAQIRALLAEIAAADPTIDLRVNDNLAIAAFDAIGGRLHNVQNALDNLRARVDSRSALLEVAKLQLAVKDAANTIGRLRVRPE